MNRKAFLLVILGIFLVLGILLTLLIIPSFKGDDSLLTEETPWMTLVILYASSDYNKRLILGAREEAESLGYGLEVFDANYNDEKMVQMLYDAVLRKTDALIISHGDHELLLPPVKKALEENIPVTVIHNDLQYPGVTLIGQDDWAMQEIIMGEMIRDFGGIVDFILIWIGGFEPMERRIEVYDRMMAENPGLRELERFGVATDSTALHTEASMLELLPRYEEGEIDAVMATWDEYAKGASLALMKQGKRDIPVYGVDLSDTVLSMVQDRDNPWVATVGVDSKDLGAMQVRLMDRALSGETLERTYSIAPVLVRQEMLPETGDVTMENYRDFLPGNR